MANPHWIFTAAGKWHAWPIGERKTMCGRVNAEHLRARPAVKMSATAPLPGEVRCVTCVKKAFGDSIPEAVSAHLDGNVRLWDVHLADFFRRTLRVKTVKKATRELLAEHMAEYGTPHETTALAILRRAQAGILAPRFIDGPIVRGKVTPIAIIPKLHPALERLPRGEQSLLRIITALELWASLTQRPITDERYNLETVVDTVLRLPDNHDAYIRRLVEKGLPSLAAVFHPNTLERASRDPALRGLFAGSSAYWNDTASTLNIVTE